MLLQGAAAWQLRCRCRELLQAESQSCAGRCCGVLLRGTAAVCTGCCCRGQAQQLQGAVAGCGSRLSQVCCRPLRVAQNNAARCCCRILLQAEAAQGAVAGCCCRLLLQQSVVAGCCCAETQCCAGCCRKVLLRAAAGRDSQFYMGCCRVLSHGSALQQGVVAQGVVAQGVVAHGVVQAKTQSCAGRLLLQGVAAECRCKVLPQAGAQSCAGCFAGRCCRDSELCRLLLQGSARRVLAL